MLFFVRHTFLGDHLSGLTDCHSHLLCGVDDGSSSVEQSRAMVDVARNAGVVKMWCTPHIMTALHSLDTSVLRDRYALLSPQLSLPTDLAAEYMLDEGFCNRLHNSPLTLDGGRVLVEFHPTMPALGSADMLFEVAMAGFAPVVAHPERYSWVIADRGKRSVEQWRRCRYKLQLNLGSLAGLYGAEVCHTATSMLTDRLYDFAGSDAHSVEQLKAIVAARIDRRLVAPLADLVERGTV